MFPWGDEWLTDTAVWARSDGTADAGSLPAGASWVGALDMSGNLAEWVNSIYGLVRFPYPYNRDDGREDITDRSALRIQRGGSYNQNVSALSTIRRVPAEPFVYSSSVGFRCARDFDED